MEVEVVRDKEDVTEQVAVPLPVVLADAVRERVELLLPERLELCVSVWEADALADTVCVPERVSVLVLLAEWVTLALPELDGVEVWLGVGLGVSVGVSVFVLLLLQETEGLGALAVKVAVVVADWVRLAVCVPVPVWLWESVVVNVWLHVSDTLGDRLGVGVPLLLRDPVEEADQDRVSLAVTEGVAEGDRVRDRVQEAVRDGLVVGVALQLSVWLRVLDCDAVGVRVEVCDWDNEADGEAVWVMLQDVERVTEGVYE
eukprot:TRINITY_DN11497_c0_g1_i3.p3 TRINITY_DN11497_c0_g1~~TRINITY_DN11497_c0_g1_i3.p3  ORF type:complete len:258 (+),score=46.33 TRINITY_DN11497_c0_g1_i3:966-1739(+)